MNFIWVALAAIAPLSLITLVGNRLLNDSLTHEGLCPVCSGAGGPCKHCNGLGVIVKTTKEQISEKKQ